MRLELTTEDQVTLRAILEEHLGKLRAGPGKAESTEFKSHLKTRTEIVKGLIARLEGEQAKAA